MIIMPAAARTAAVQPTSPVVAADPVPAPVPANGQAAYRAYGRELFALPGVASVGWLRAAPGEIRVSFSTDAFRRLADNVLRDTINGVKLVLVNAEGAPAPVPGADPWADNVNDIIRAVRALPGVIDGGPDSEHGVHTAGFSTVNGATGAKLTQLVNPMIGRYRVYFHPSTPPKPA